MEEFPFTEDEWGRVNRVTCELTNATLMDDDVLCAAKLCELTELLHELQASHGEHPVLVETQADFEEDPKRRRELYAGAIALALINGLPTYTIRLSLASLLCEQFDQPGQASEQLKLAEIEVERLGDEWDQKQWQESWDRVAKRLGECG